MSVLADAAAGATGTVTLVTESLLAFAALFGSVVLPVYLARRRSRKEALAAAAARAVNSSDLTLSGWTALNAALQQEITRLQGVQERMQARIDQLESEIETLRKLALSFQKGSSSA